MTTYSDFKKEMWVETLKLKAVTLLSDWAGLARISSGIAYSASTNPESAIYLKFQKRVMLPTHKDDLFIYYFSW